MVKEDKSFNERKDSSENIEPKYYSKNGLSPLSAMKKGLVSKNEYIGFLKGNVIKYTIRAEDKGGIEDIDKAIDYLNHLKKEINKNIE